MELILNERLDAIEWLMSHKAAGLTIQIDSNIVTAILSDGDYYHAKNIVELVRLLKQLDKVDNAQSDTK